MVQNRFFINPAQPDERLIQQAAYLLNQKGIVIYPTDTTYVFGVNATDVEMVLRLYQMKGRDFSKPFHIVVPDITSAEEYCVVTEDARLLAEKFLPGPLTLVLTKRDNIPDLLVSGLSTVGIRIPKNQICLKLACQARIPITNTTANVSGRQNPYSIEEVSLWETDISTINMILDQGPLPRIRPSTMVDLTVTPPRILREGPISEQDLFNVLGHA